MTPISGLHFAVLNDDGGVYRYPVVALDGAGDLIVTHFAEPRSLNAWEILDAGDVVGMAVVSATLPRDQVISACRRNGTQFV